MKSSNLDVLVTGATGKQGGAVVRHLLARGHRVRALCRRPSSPRAEALSAAGVRVFQGDLDDRSSIDRAISGAYGVFSVQDYWDGAPEKTLGPVGEERQGRNVLDAARIAGVRHVVQASGAGVTTAPYLAANRGKAAIERYGRSLGIPFTVIRGAYFMENFDDPKMPMLAGLLQGQLCLPFDADTRLQMVACDDVGALATLAFERTEELGTSTFDAAGDELSMVQIAETFSRVMGREVRFAGGSDGLVEVRKSDPDMADLFASVNELGFLAFIPALRALLPELTTLETYLRRAGWGERGTSGLAA
ncbi:MAG: NmrA/HSCARG family protein [Polyangiaceae bacterium]